MEENEELSPMELALTYIDEHPELVNKIEGDDFAIFWQEPSAVIKQYKATTQMLKTSFGFTDEMIELYCLDYMSDACKHIEDLKAKDPENAIFG